MIEDRHTTSRLDRDRGLCLGSSHTALIYTPDALFLSSPTGSAQTRRGNRELRFRTSLWARRNAIFVC